MSLRENNKDFFVVTLTSLKKIFGEEINNDSFEYWRGPLFSFCETVLNSHGNTTSADAKSAQHQGQQKWMYCHPVLRAVLPQGGAFKFSALFLSPTSKREQQGPVLSSLIRFFFYKSTGGFHRRKHKMPDRESGQCTWQRSTLRDYFKPYQQTDLMNR